MSNRPIRTLHYYDKAEKVEYEIAAIFKGDRFDWKNDVSPSKGETRNPKYPQMLASEAFKRAEQKLGYISEKTPKRDAKPQQNYGTSDDGFNDDSIPF